MPSHLLPSGETPSHIPTNMHALGLRHGLSMSLSYESGTAPLSRLGGTPKPRLHDTADTLAVIGDVPAVVGRTNDSCGEIGHVNRGARWFSTQNSSLSPG